MMYIDVNYIRVKRKTIKIEVTTKGDVNVFYPEETSIIKAREFVAKKKKWIKSKVDAAKTRVKNNAEIFDLKAIFLLGKKVKIEFCDVKRVSLAENLLLVPQKLSKDTDELKKALRRFISKFANELLPQAVSYFAEIIGKCPAKVSISHPKTLWGSCNVKKEIRLNAKLIMLPKTLMEYVIVHELCHLAELNHSERFWSAVGKFCDIKSCRKALKEFNFLITLF